MISILANFIPEQIIPLTNIQKMTDKKKLISFLSEMVTERRIQRFNEVISRRTGYLRVVVEDLYQGHNASAVIRSCDCFGVQHMHFIENKNSMKVNDEIALGAGSWVSVHKHKSTLECFQELKNKGYRIVATTPHKNDYTIDSLPLDNKIALVFGTELSGISEEVIKQADEFVKIPMFGFTESFNISVSAALCMYELTKRIRKEKIKWELEEEEKTEVYLQWLMNSIENSEEIIKRLNTA